MRDRRVMKLASRGKRLGAFCIDMIIPCIAFMMLFIAMIAAAVRDAYRNGFGYNNDPFSGYGYGFGNGYGYGYGYNSGISAGIVVTISIALLMLLAYTVIQLILYNRSKTLGKSALGLQVVSSEDGKPIGFWKMLFREWFVKRASECVIFLGYLWVVIDDKNRGWHDKILDTYVVDLKESEKLAPARPRAGAGAQAGAAAAAAAQAVSEAVNVAADVVVSSVEAEPEPETIPEPEVITEPEVNIEETETDTEIEEIKVEEDGEEQSCTQSTAE